MKDKTIKIIKPIWTAIYFVICYLIWTVKDPTAFLSLMCVGVLAGYFLMYLARR